MSTSAHERRCWQFNHAARNIANSLFQKWAIKGFFPAGERSEPRTRTAPKGLPQDEARDAQRGGPPLESPCRVLSLVLSFASKESTSPLGAAAPPTAPESARQSPPGTRGLRPRAHQRAFRSPFGNLRASKLARGSPTFRAVVGASGPLARFCTAKLIRRCLTAPFCCRLQ